MRIIFIFVLLLSAQCTTNYQHSANQNKDPYCEVSSKTVNETNNGNSVNKYSKTTVECDDGPKSFMKKSGLANDCRYFNWRMPLGNTHVEQRTISCRRLDGGYEIIPNYKLQN